MLVATAAFFVYQKSSPSEQEVALEQEKSALPGAVSQPLESKSPTPESQPLPGEYNLDVPFTSQAPHGNWDEVHEETCEEASILMVERYYNEKSIESADDADGEMLEMVDWQNENFGYFESTTAAQTLQMMREFTHLDGEIIENPTIEQIKRYIFENKLVIAPLAGRELGNPFYTQPGPLYHMFVIRGYTSTEFITNDPGTRHGENYPYDFKTILDANHDWNGGDVANGARVMIVVKEDS